MMSSAYGSSSGMRAGLIAISVVAGGLVGMLGKPPRAFDRGTSTSSTATLSQEVPTASAPLDEFPAQFLAFAKSFCFDCHAGDGAEGGIDFEQLETAESLRTNSKDWQRIVHVLDARTMPPADEEQPPPMRVQCVTDLIREAASRDPELIAASANQVRRLTRLEYENTVRDLFYFRFDPIANPARLVIHDDYFRPSSRRMPDHVLAMSQLQYQDRIPPELSGISALPGDAPILHGFNNDQAMLSFPPVYLEASLNLASSIVNDEAFPELTPLWTSMFEPEDPANAARQVEQARRRLKPFLDRAFRQPVEESVLERYVKHFETKLPEAGYTGAMKSAVTAILSSPRFLFPHDRSEPSLESGMPAEFATASRLSYFLWGTMPDAELFSAAAEGRLSSEEQIRIQVRRMLMDRRIRHLSIDFASQWLKLSKVLSARPDRDLFPGWYEWASGSPAASMMIEQMLLFETILVEDRSILEFINADFAYLNITLMNWYNLRPEELLGFKPADDSGEDFFRIQWTNLHRGGIISSGAMLVSTSATTRTSPVYRGAWLLEVLFNRPAPPPPPNVPALDGDDNPAINISHPREKLAKHREDPACASCHNRIDPIGFALEKFDPVGKFRHMYPDGTTIDDSGEIFGEGFAGAARFRLLVGRNQDAFVRGFVEHLAKYAAGRELTLADEKSLSRIFAAVPHAGFRISSVIEEVCVSPMIRVVPRDPAGVPVPSSEENP